MDSHGEFHEVKKNGKLFLVYHHPKYNPIPQTISGEVASSNDHPSQLLFLCLMSRQEKDSYFYALNSCFEYVLSATRDQQGLYVYGHHVLPFFWCNNKEFDDNGGCDICEGSNIGTYYYFCDTCDKIFHKECVESPVKIKHPFHPQHYLQLYYVQQFYHVEEDFECLCCGRRALSLVYYCTICQTFMHPICAMKSICFVIDQPKRHYHPLTFFPRLTSLTYNVCSLLRKIYPIYICVRCNFLAHKDCMYSPSIIRISCHHHCISYVSSLHQSGEWSCGVCYQSIDSNYGAYTCDKCGDYAVHSRCGVRKDVWDGVELEGVHEEDDITQDYGPKGVIRHFLHEHHFFA